MTKTRPELKFAYLRDKPVLRKVHNKETDKCEEKFFLSPRVLTIAYQVWNGELRFAAVVNKVVHPKKTLLDPKLRQVMSRQEFRALQKRYSRRFGGDQHCKKAARAILTQRWEAGQFTTIAQTQTSALASIVDYIATKQAVSYINKELPSLPQTAGVICLNRWSDEQSKRKNIREAAPSDEEGAEKTLQGHTAA